MKTNNLLSTSNLLAAGIVAGPLFVALALAQAFMRDGFDIVRHPASLLLLGDLGWLQIANFVIAGTLFIAAAVGLKRALAEGVGRKWAPRLLIVFGAALIIGGVFTPDPGLGFPVGAPEGIPKEKSWHASIHSMAPIAGFVALVAALIVLARRFGRLGQRGWMQITIAVAIASFVLSNLPNMTADWESGTFNFLPLWLGTILGFCWASYAIAKVKKESDNT